MRLPLIAIDCHWLPLIAIDALGVLQVRTLLEAGAARWEPTLPGRSPLLHVATYSGQASIARMLLTIGRWAVDEEDWNGAQAIHLAAFEGREDVVSALLEHGANAAAIDSEDLMTPLHFAAYRGHLAAARALVDAGAPLKTEDAHGSTPIAMATNQHHAEMVELLQAAGT